MKKTTKKILEFIILFIIGGAIYYMIEVCHRGWSHWTMFLLGGLCFIIVGYENEYILDTYHVELPLLPQMVSGCILITTLELVVGYIVNIRLGWKIWDYSNEPFNFLGQICLGASLAWFGLSLVIILLDDFLRYKLFGGEKREYKLI